MRVLFVSPYPPAVDGIGDYTSRLAAAVRGCGHDVRVVLPRRGVGSPPDVLGAIDGRLSRQAGSVRRDIARFSPDLVHVQFAVAAFGARTLALLRWLKALRHDLHGPVVITMHEVTRDTALLRAPGRSLYRAIARHCDLIIVHTETARATLTGLRIGLPGKVVVIPHPAARPPDGQMGQSQLRDRFGLGHVPLLLAFGFIHVDKGLQDLVRALGVLRRTGGLAPGEARLVIAGVVRRRSGLMRPFEFPDRLHQRMVLRQARRSGVRDQLVLTGYVPDAEVVGWFRAADAVVLPYRKIEESGVAAIAVALGVPVLASRVGGLAEQFGDSPWTFPARDPDALAKVLARFLAAPSQQRETARQHRQTADMAAVVSRTLDVYARAVAATARGLARVG
jgi:glycosyltransferase involved in cell wall biosynthesis